MQYSAEGRIERMKEQSPSYRVVSSDDKCLHARQMMNHDITTTNINPFRLTTRHCLLAVDCLQSVLDIAKYLLLLLFWLMLVVIVAFAAAIYYCYC